MPPKVLCWSCEKEWEINSQPVTCANCGKVQKIIPNASPYLVLGYETSTFNIDLEELETRWLKRSRRCHPDRFAMRDAAERRYAVEQMAATNDAQKMLSNDIARGAFLVEQRGWPTEVFPPEEFLMDMMEAQESAHDAGPHRASLKADFEARFAADREVLGATLDAGIGTPEEAAGALTRLRYFQRVLDALRGQAPEV